VPGASFVKRAREVYEASAVLRRRPELGVISAVSAVSLGAIVRFILGEVLHGFPFLTIFPAVIVTGFFCGARAGAVAGVLGGVLAWYYWIDPPQSFLVRDSSAWIGLLLYNGISAVMLLLMTGMHHGFAAYADIERERSTINEELERRVSVRTLELAEANAKLVKEAAAREVAEAHVRQMQRLEAVGQLTGGVAHDFNNMLAVIVGSVQMARRHLDKDRDRVVVCLDNAVDGAQRAAELVRRLLAFSRQAALEPRVIDPNKLVGGMTDLLHRTLGENIHVETVLGAGIWRIFADAPELESAVLNLCVNARDAMPEGGKLTIETSNADLDDAYVAADLELNARQYVLIAVTDTGVGMPSEVIARAFEPFYTTKGAGRGSGLGLSQVYGFVRQSGGTVKVYSEPGEGTCVKIYLPRRHGNEPVAQVAQARRDAPRGKSEEIILVVEDDERVRQVSVEALRELGYTVVQAEGAAQALAALRIQPRIDLLFTDIVMPDTNGRDLAEQARRQRPDLRVLFTTGYTRNAVVHHGTLDPGVALLTKPFTIEQLAAKVRQMLDAD